MITVCSGVQIVEFVALYLLCVFTVDRAKLTIVRDKEEQYDKYTVTK